MKRYLLLTLIVIVALGVSVVPAAGASFTVPATYADIQAAINAASPGDTIFVNAGTATLAQTEVITIPTSKLGIKLVGAGAGQTILQKSAGNTDQSILFIGQTSPPPPPAAAATVVEGFTFKNSGATSGTRTSSNSAYRGVHIRASGVSPDDPAIIRNNEFLGFSDTGIAFGDFALAYWEISGNVFDGSRLAIWINSTDFVNIQGNLFQNYVVAVGFDPNDIVTDLAITGNSLLGGSYDPTPGSYYGLYMSTASPNIGFSKTWNISTNVITGATYGVRVLAPTSGSLFQSLTDVSLRDNCIYDNNTLGTASVTPYGINNMSTEVLDAVENWWGDASGPFHPVSNPGGAGNGVSDNVSFSPWLTKPASPCAPPVIEILIDIKPGSYPNSINLKSKGVVPVAVLTTDDFDATTVDPSTVLFAGASPLRWSFEDVDGDGDMDMLFHFKTQDLNLDENSTEASLIGETLDGTDIQGTDTVNIVPN